MYLDIKAYGGIAIILTDMELLHDRRHFLSSPQGLHASIQADTADILLHRLMQ